MSETLKDINEILGKVLDAKIFIPDQKTDAIGIERYLMTPIQMAKLVEKIEILANT